MESRAFYMKAKRGGAEIRVIGGHFATKHSHINYCLDLTRVKSELKMARAAARLFAEDFVNTPVDTIITLERMKMVGAFLARDLSHTGINLNQDIAVITPEINEDNKMILRDNFIPYIKDKDVLLMTASATTGMTVAAALDGIRYYGGRPAGAATVFGGEFSTDDVPLIKLFGVEDLPDYESFAPVDCPLCKKGIKVDAVVNSYGYSKI